MVSNKTAPNVSDSVQTSRRKSKGRILRLLFVDECKISLEAWKSYLSSRSGFLVKGLAPNRIQDLRQAASASPNVVVMTLPLLKDEGVDAIHLLFEIVPAAKLIGFGGDGDFESVTAMLRAGVRGFVQRNCSPRDLIRAIECVWRGEVFLSPWIQKMIVERDGIHARPSDETVGARLTERDREIVQGIADGLSNKEVASRLGMSVRTVEKRRLLVMEKLQIAGVAQLTKYAIRNGITALE